MINRYRLLLINDSDLPIPRTPFMSTVLMLPPEKAGYELLTLVIDLAQML
jgi:hypothetical protein